MKLKGNETFRLDVPLCHPGLGKVEELIRDGVLVTVDQSEFHLEIQEDGRIPTLDDFIAMFNEVMFRKFRGTEKNARQFNARIREGHTLDEMHRATVAAKKDPFHKEKRYKYLTPEYMLRAEILQRWLNVEAEPEKRSMFDGEEPS